MYESFYSLRERPFDLTPNPRYLYLTASHREALSTLQYGISGRRGLTVMIGEAGTGKTTLMRAAVEALDGRGVLCAYVNNPALTRQEFYELLRMRLGLEGDPTGSKARFLVDLERLALERHDAGGVTALVIDEAQSLPPALLEEIRLLANIETETDKLLPVVLAGQPELAARLDAPEFRQLKQRVALRCELAALTLQETAAYIAGRIRIAGGDSSRIFTREAVQAIFEHSLGIPRTISVICDNALVTGFAAEARPIGSGLVLDVCRDFGLTAAGKPWPGGDGGGGSREIPQPAGGRPTAKGNGGASKAAPGPRASAPASERRLFSHYGGEVKRRRFFDFLFLNRTGGNS